MSIYRRLLRENAGLRFFFGISAGVLITYLLYLGVKEVYAYLQLLSYYRELEEAGEAQALGGAADLLFEAMCYCVVVFGGAVVTVVWVIAEYFSEATIAIQKLIWFKRESPMASSIEKRLGAIESRLNTIVGWFKDVEELSERQAILEKMLADFCETPCDKECTSQQAVIDGLHQQIKELTLRCEAAEARSKELKDYALELKAFYEDKA